jgi:hypothetical protein
MPIQLQSAVFSTNGALAASSCGANALGQSLLEFGFPASGLRIVNTCGVRMYLNLAGQAATTAMGFLATGETFNLQGEGFRTCGLGLTSTSTSTAAGAQPLYGVTAWASA